MELSREVLAKAEFIIINSAEPDLRPFLGNYYMIKNPEDNFDPGSALCYSDELTIKEVQGNPCMMFWSRKIVSSRVRDIIGKRTIIEGRDIREDYVMHFLSMCGA
jgi:hypothetical protein